MGNPTGIAAAAVLLGAGFATRIPLFQTWATDVVADAHGQREFPDYYERLERVKKPRATGLRTKRDRAY